VNSKVNFEDIFDIISLPDYLCLLDIEIDKFLNIKRANESLGWGGWGRGEYPNS